MGVGSEFNRYDRGNSFVKGRSINIEVGYLTTFGEVDPKVLRVSAGERIYGASSLEGHGSSGWITWKTSSVTNLPCMGQQPAHAVAVALGSSAVASSPGHVRAAWGSAGCSGMELAGL